MDPPITQCSYTMPSLSTTNSSIHSTIQHNTYTCIPVFYPCTCIPVLYLYLYQVNPQAAYLTMPLTPQGTPLGNPLSNPQPQPHYDVCVMFVHISRTRTSTGYLPVCYHGNQARVITTCWTPGSSTARCVQVTSTPGIRYMYYLYIPVLHLYYTCTTPVLHLYYLLMGINNTITRYWG